jgi:hypothetical protein
MCPSALKPDAPRVQVQRITEKVPVAKAAPEKTDADIQKTAESERRRLALSTEGFSSLIATGSFGDLTLPDTSFVSLGGR